MKRLCSFSVRRFLLTLLVLAANDFLMPLSVSDQDSAMAILLFLMPLLTLLVCFAYGCSARSTPLLVVVSALIFFLSSLLLFSDARLAFTLLYAFLSLIGYGMGCMVRGVVSREQKRMAEKESTL